MSKKHSLIYQRLFFCIFWVGACFGFVADEMLTSLQGARSMVFLGLDALWLLLAVLTVRRRSHLIAIGVFITVSFAATCLVNGLAIVYWMNGLRDFFGILCAYPIMCYFMGDDDRRARFESALDRALLCFLLVQAFCVTYQFMLYGAGDHCGGSFGNWYSGQVSTCIYIASFHLVHRRLDTSRFFGGLRENIVPVVLLFPTFLNETKISCVLLALYIGLLWPLDRRYLVRAMWMLPVTLAMAWAAVMAYTSLVKDSDDVFSLDYVTEYMLTDVDDAEGGALWDIDHGGVTDVPRLTKIAYLPLLHEQEPGHELMGWGTGQFKGGKGIEVSEFAYEYDWLLMGSIPYVFHVHIQLGVIGVMLVAAWLVMMFVMKPSWSGGRDYNVQAYALLIILMIMCYNDSLRDLWMCSILFAFLATSFKPIKTTPKRLSV